MAPQSGKATFEKIDLFKQPVISDKMARIYRIAALVILLSIGTMIMDSYLSGGLAALVNNDWHWLMYIILVPVLFFSKEIYNGSQHYLSIDFDREILTIIKSRTQKEELPFHSIKDITFDANKFKLKPLDGPPKLISTADLLYKDVQQLKSILNQIRTLTNK